MTGTNLFNITFMFRQQLERAVVCCFDQSPHFLVNDLRCLFTVWLRHYHVTRLRHLKGHVSNSIVHAKLRNLVSQT